MIQEIMHI